MVLGVVGSDIGAPVGFIRTVKASTVGKGEGVGRLEKVKGVASSSKASFILLLSPSLRK